MSKSKTNETSRNPKLKLSDERIVAILDAGIGQAMGLGGDNKLSKERQKVELYYEGEYPKRAHHGDSGYTSLDVWDGVEAMKAQLLEVFTGNNRPVVFDPANGEDVVAAQVRTDYVTNVLFSQNHGYKIMQDVIDNGLKFRVGVAKVWWEQKEKTEYFHLTEASAEEAQQFLAKHPDAEIDEVDFSEDGVAIKRMTLKMKKDVSQVRAEVLAPEEFFISGAAKTITDAHLCGHKREVSVSELIKLGYDEKIVKELTANDDLWTGAETDKMVRFGETDDMIGSRYQDTGQHANRVCVLHECYLELDVEDTGDGEGSYLSQLYKITKCGTTILDKEPVDRKPFVVFTPLPRAQAFWGTNFANLLTHTQRARTFLTRSIINHALVTNNPRLMVVQGAVTNPRELMENRLGGLVNVTRPDGIVPLPQTGLNPFVFQTIQLLDHDKEEITGISQLSQGLNKDAVSKQNSQGMIQELISVSQIRQKIIARNFAEHFLRDLYDAIYRLVVENEDRQKIVQIAGSWTPVDFTQWPETCEMTVSFSLGYGEQQKEAAKFLNIHHMLASTPALAGQYTPTQQYATLKKVLEAGGIKDTDSFLLPPDKAQPPPPDPLHQAEVAMKNADAAAKQASAQAVVQQLQMQQAELASKERVEMQRLQIEAQRASQQHELEMMKLQHKIAVDAAEIALQQQAQADAKLQAEAMPTR